VRLESNFDEEEQCYYSMFLFAYFLSHLNMKL
jgi:hypothetical protein